MNTKVILASSIMMTKLMSAESVDGIFAKTDALLKLHNIVLGVGPYLVKPADGACERCIDLVKAQNKKVSITGLPEELNPLSLSIDNVSALFLRFAKIPKQLEQLRDTEMRLDNEELHLNRAYPILANAVAEFATIQVTRKKGKVTKIKLQITPDLFLAQTYALKGKELMVREEKEVERLSGLLNGKPDDVASKRQLLNMLSDAKRRRWCGALIWSASTKALVKAGDKERQEEAKTANSKSEEYLVPPWTGMP